MIGAYILVTLALARGFYAFMCRDMAYTSRAERWFWMILGIVVMSAVGFALQLAVEWFL